MLSLLDRNLGQNHHIYQDNFYNSVRLTQTLLDRNVRVCGNMMANRGIPRDLEGGSRQLKEGQSVFWRNGDVMVQGWCFSVFGWACSFRLISDSLKVFSQCNLHRRFLQGPRSATTDNTLTHAQCSVLSLILFVNWMSFIKLKYDFV